MGVKITEVWRVTSPPLSAAGSFFTGQSSKNNEEVSLIRKADLENHNKDGGFWTVIDGKVYDIKDFQAQSQSLTGNSILGKVTKCVFEMRISQNTLKFHVGFSHHSFVFFPVTAQFAGEDPVVALEAALQFEDTRESMQAFCVGQYMEVPNGFSVGFIPDVWLQAFIFSYFIPYSLTRRQSPLQTSAVCPPRLLTLRGTWGCCWASMPPTWPRAPPCRPWRSNVPVGS